MSKPSLKLALKMARALNTKGEDNNEYLRGQVNLICDLYGLLGQDGASETVECVLTHRVTVKAGLAYLREEGLLP